MSTSKRDPQETMAAHFLRLLHQTGYDTPPDRDMISTTPSYLLSGVYCAQRLSISPLYATLSTTTMLRLSLLESLLLH